MRLLHRELFMLFFMVFCGGSIVLVVLSGSTLLRQRTSPATSKLLFIGGNNAIAKKDLTEKGSLNGTAFGNTTQRFTQVNQSDVNNIARENLANFSSTGPLGGDANINASKLIETANSSRLSEWNGECQPQRASRQMVHLFGDKFNTSLEPFLTMDTLRASDPATSKLQLPFGLNGSEKDALSLMQKLPEPGIPNSIRKLSCRRCVVMGNGGLLKGSKLGPIIDGYDVIIRLNMAPVEGYESDVGSKTTLRLLYPESSTLKSSAYTPGWLLVVVPFKRLDITWAANMAEGKNMGAGGFWQKIAKSVPKSKEEIRLFNPHVTRELAEDLIGFKLGTGKMAKNTPTTGAMAIAMAIRLCDEVSVAGFGYGGLKPNDPVHYFHDNLLMKSFMASRTHNIGPERELLKNLVREGVIQDLTKGLL